MSKYLLVARTESGPFVGDVAEEDLSVVKDRAKFVLKDAEQILAIDICEVLDTVERG